MLYINNIRLQWIVGNTVIVSLSRQCMNRSQYHRLDILMNKNSEVCLNMFSYHFLGLHDLVAIEVGHLGPLLK